MTIDVHMVEDGQLDIHLGLDGIAGGVGPEGEPGTTDPALIMLPPEASALLGGATNLLDALIWLAEHGGVPPIPLPFWSAYRGFIGVL